jgi:CBS-domain-containing membrane protein
MLRRCKLPDRIANAPSLFLGNEIWFTAFLDLSNEREIGWGAGPIRWTAMRDYAEAWDLDLEDLEYFIREMDKVYLTKTAPKKP